MLIFAATLAIFVYGMVAAMLGTIHPGLAAKFYLDNIQTGCIALALAIGLIIASVSVGPLIDRKGKKVGLLLGLGLVTAASILLASASGYGQFMLAMVLLGTGGGITLAGANALGSDVSESRRATVLNFLNVFVGLGGLVTPFVAGNLLSGDALRVAYGGAILTAIAFLATAMTKIPAPAQGQGQVAGSGAIFKRPVLYLLALSVMLYTACEFGIWNWLAKYLITHGIPESTALTVLSLGFALAPLIGRIAVAPVLIKTAPQTTGPTSAAIAVFCTGLAMAPVFPTTVAMVGNVLKQGTATAIGFAITCAAVSSPMIGWLAGTDPQGLGAGLMLLPVLSLLPCWSRPGALDAAGIEVGLRTP